ncbi:MAG: hypothetical protein IMW89_19165 [Ktedonobacteraceae bacterium]|nr:hypothetical protein [Ktedonobacteraceae bacterium]
MIKAKDIMLLLVALEQFYTRHHTYFPVDTQHVIVKSSLVKLSHAWLVGSLHGIRQQTPPKSDQEIFEEHASDLISLVSPLRHHDETIRVALEALERSRADDERAPTKHPGTM